MLVRIILSKFNKQAGWGVVHHVIQVSEKILESQNAVEGTHRVLVQVVLTLNHPTTLLTGSAAYSLQDTPHQNTSHCSNQGMPPAIDRIFNLLIMYRNTLWSRHIICQRPSHRISLVKTGSLPIPQTTVVKIHFELVTCVFV